MKRISITGNITADATVKNVQNKKAINFAVAVNEYYKNKDGEKCEKTTFFNCTLWRDSNIEVAKYLLKGTKMYIDGNPEVEMWKTKSGETVAGIKINVEFYEFLNRPNGQATTTQNNSTTSSNVPNYSGDGKKDDLPF